MPGDATGGSTSSCWWITTYHQIPYSVTATSASGNSAAIKLRHTPA
jgi:hypothetical protein